MVKRTCFMDWKITRSRDISSDSLLACAVGLPPRGQGVKVGGEMKRYLCQRCTNCCRWPGFVKLTDADIPAIASFLGMEERQFIQEFTRLRPSRDGLALTDQPDGACIFLDGRDCRIQPVKPAQCGGFPNTWNFPGWREVCEAVEVEEFPGQREF